MKKWRMYGDTNIPRPGMRLVSTGGIGLALAIAAGGSAALAMRPTAGSTLASGQDSHLSNTDVHTGSKQFSTSPAISATAGRQSQSSGNSIAFPGATKTNTSSTTITVNGKTTQVSGNESIDKSYVDDDGTTRVDISVHNSITNKGSTAGDEVNLGMEDGME